MHTNQQYKRLEKRYWKIAEKLRLRNGEVKELKNNNKQIKRNYAQYQRKDSEIAELHKDRIILEKQVQELLKTKGEVTQRQVKDIINAYKREKEELKCNQNISKC